jgi:hypothetical protein
MRRALCGGFLVAMLTLPLGAGEKLIMRVSPEMSRAPGRVVVRTTIEKDPDNRALAIVAESADYYRSSTVQLNGDRAARTAVFQFGSLPSGEYRVSAWLLGTGDTVRATVYRAVIVWTAFEGPPP